MVEFPGGRSLVYKSDNIFERRRRILREARKLISEGGLAGFSVGELCTRAGIARKTLYNAFGTRENVIAQAIRQYQAEFDERATPRLDQTTLEGRLERLIKVHSRNLQIRPYASAVMALYHSPTVDLSIRQAIRSVSDAQVRPLAEALEGSGSLLPGVTAESFIDLHISSVYGRLADWCLGDIPDDQLIDRICECFLVVVVGMSQGQANTHAQHWLEDLRAGRPSWAALRRMAEADDELLAEPEEPRETDAAAAIAAPKVRRSTKR